MPTRRISEKICRSEDYKSMTLFQRDLFWRLIVNADDFGRFDGRLNVLKSALFPLESVTEKAIDEGLKGLSTIGIVDLYVVGGKPYLRLTSWLNYQQQRAHESKYPAPDVDNCVENSLDIVCNQLISNECKCSRLIDSERLDNTDCKLCPLGARAYEVDRMLQEVAGYKEPDWRKIMRIARKMRGIEMPLVRKAVLLSLEADDKMAYLNTLAEDWIVRGIHTFDDFRLGKGSNARN